MKKELVLPVVFLGFFSFGIFKSPSISAADNSKSESKSNQEKTIFDRIEELTGFKGTFNKDEGVFKVTYPRTDLEVVAAGVKIKPAMGLTSWAAFKDLGYRSMMMGDLVLLEDQVNLVMSVALDNGLEVTALHNHFFWDAPKVMFMHVAGSGDVEKLAAAVGKVFEKIKETSGGKNDKKPSVNVDPEKTTLDPKKIEAILGQKGEVKDGIFKIVFGRSTTMNGYTMGDKMGVNTWAAFAGSDDQAVVDGDFAMLESEVQSVLKALRGSKIEIVAIHNHMIMESPRIIFLHYWGVGSTADLANGLKAAMDTQQKSI